MRTFPTLPTWLKRTVTALALATVVGGVMAAPAFADDDDWGHGRGWGHGRHEWREHHRGYHGPGVVYVRPPVTYYEPPPAVVYAPPPAVVYAPPPVVYAPPPTFTVVVPLHF